MLESKALSKAVTRLHDLNPDGKDEGLTKAETACYILDGIISINKHYQTIIEATREDWENMKYSNHKEDLE